jgi:AcrR family transcriptional regulator
MPARPKVSEPRRDEIMPVAKKVFGRNGFDATTIADVAKEAGLPFDVVYQYFDSKDTSFQALIAAQEHALRTHVAVALAASGASFGYAEVPFRATLRAMIEFFDADRAAAKLLFRDAYTKNNGSTRNSAASTSATSTTSKPSSSLRRGGATWWLHRPGWWRTP